LISKGAMGLLVGLSLVLAGVWTGRQLHTVWNTWPSTDGTVVRGDVQETLVIPSKGGMPVHHYTPKIEFHYRVSGMDYTTATLSIYSAETYADAARNLARMYAPGTHHPIRYNPSDPRDIEFGVIEFAPLGFSFLLLISGIALSVVGLSMLARSYSRPAELAATLEQEIPATVLPFPNRPLEEPGGTIRCPACGRLVKSTEETCPNCLKFLRAA
jgi:hypothetical protein